MVPLEWFWPAALMREFRQVPCLTDSWHHSDAVFDLRLMPLRLSAAGWGIGLGLRPGAWMLVPASRVVLPPPASVPEAAWAETALLAGHSCGRIFCGTQMDWRPQKSRLPEVAPFRAGTGVRPPSMVAWISTTAAGGSVSGCELEGPRLDFRCRAGLAGLAVPSPVRETSDPCGRHPDRLRLPLLVCRFPRTTLVQEEGGSAQGALMMRFAKH